ncbi:hypothetical protein BDN71DRAFT_1505580 [Pleurotus eryngii]|uniref:Uncharacterized protein n=1 Tax=Pleurotus eryngii TaxID=5323 RepID=A0A9P5ZZ14_PLEER|nr:hypothetical protein BDN71DRAFT_1505580 [Pleurotus eryngii]
MQRPSHLRATLALSLSIAVGDIRYVSIYIPRSPPITPFEGGTPGNMVNVTEQLGDFRAVIKYVRSQHQYGPNKVVLWATSLSGGHAITLASDMNIAATVTQCPSTGVACKVPLGPGMVTTLCAAVYDWFRQMLELAPYYIPATGSPGTVGALTYEIALTVSAAKTSHPTHKVVAKDDNICDSSSTLKVAHMAQGSITVLIPTGMTSEHVYPTMKF